MISPKQMVRRDHIYASAAKLIAERGFKPMTMRELATEAGVSTGMVNHYFTNKSQLLIGTLRYVSEQMQARVAAALDASPAGPARLDALLRNALPADEFSRINWKVWIHAFAEASRSEEMRAVITERYVGWYRTLEAVLVDGCGVAPPDAASMAIELDAMMNGLVIHQVIVGPGLSSEDIREALLRFVDGRHSAA